MKPSALAVAAAADGFMPLPKIDQDVQKAVAERGQISFALRRNSKELLEIANQSVELAIDQGEDAALEWLKAKA